MNLEDRLDHEIWWVMQQLKKELALSDSTTFLLNREEPFDMDGDEYVPGYKTQVKILRKLESRGVITIEGPDNLTIGSEVVIPGVTAFDKKEEVKKEFRITVLQPQFDSHFKEYTIKMAPSPEQSMSETSKRKILHIMERLKEEWEISPKKVSRRSYSMYENSNVREASLSDDKLTRWMRGAGIGDYYELESVLSRLVEEGVIEKFESINPAM